MNAGDERLLSRLPGVGKCAFPRAIQEMQSLATPVCMKPGEAVAMSGGGSWRVQL